uniref:protein-tyrosine-phosphatase n=1 Tax=Eptatretus burgeri TaxID=7764 RepID=A0A8C4Q4G6_EPTBU
MPYVKWMTGGEIEGAVLIGRNVLELYNVLQSDNYTCVAMSSLGVIKTAAEVTVKALPQAPTKPQVTETTATSVTLIWRSGDPGTDQHYTLQYRPYASGIHPPFREISGIPTTRYTVGGLSPYSAYEFRVKGVNNMGHGPPSAITQTQTGERAPTTPPREVHASPVAMGTVLVTWEEPVEANGKIRGYRVNFAPVLADDVGKKWGVNEEVWGGNEDLEAQADVLETGYKDKTLRQWTKINVENVLLVTLQGLDPKLVYGVQVLGFTSVGDGPLSHEIRLVPKPGVPGQPLMVRAEAESDTTILLSWLPPGNDRLNSYLLLYHVIGQQQTYHATFQPSMTHLLEGLQPNTSYRLRLAARAVAGLGPLSDIMSSRTLPKAPRGSPRDLDLEAVNSSAVRVTWRAPARFESLVPLSAFRILYAPRSAASFPQSASEVILALPHPQPNPSMEYEMIISDLGAETTYMVAVAVVPQSGEEMQCLPKSIRTKAAVPSIPQVEVTLMQTGQALARWKPPDVTFGSLLGYHLEYRRTDNAEPPTILQFPPSSTHHLLTNLHQGTTYELVLAARNFAGLGSEARVLLATPGAPPSGAPLNLTIARIGASSTYLRWDPPSLAKRNGRIVQYEVAVKEVNSDNKEHVVEAAQLALMLTDLAPNASYEAKVRAITVEGAGPYGESVQLKVLPDQGDFVRNFRVQAVMQSAVLVAWEVVKEPENLPDFFQVIYGDNEKLAISSRSGRALLVDLQPDSEYNLVLTEPGPGPGGLLGFVGIRTAPNLLPGRPRVIGPLSTSGMLDLGMPRMKHTTHESSFFLVVIPLEILGGREIPWRSPDHMPLQQILPQSQPVGPSNVAWPGAYATAHFKVLPDRITVGDGFKYGGLLNSPLISGRDYIFFLVAQLTVRDTVRHMVPGNISQFDKIIET